MVQDNNINLTEKELIDLKEEISKNLNSLREKSTPLMLKDNKSEKEWEEIYQLLREEEVLVGEFNEISIKISVNFSFSRFNEERANALEKDGGDGAGGRNYFTGGD